MTMASNRVRKAVNTRRSALVSEVKTKNVEDYLIQLDSLNKTLALCLRPGQKPPIKDRITKIIRILSEKRIYKAGMKVIIIQMKSLDAYTKATQGAGAHLTWVDPNDPKDRILFIVCEIQRVVGITQQNSGVRLQQSASRVQQNQQRRKQLIDERLPCPRIGSNNKSVEIIDLDSDEETSDSEDTEEEPTIKTDEPRGVQSSGSVHKTTTVSGNVEANKSGSPEEREYCTTVIRGNVGGLRSLPSKTIIPASKALTPLYRVPDLNKLQEAVKKITYGVHPFLSDQFVIVTPDFIIGDENLKPKGVSVNKSVEQQGRQPRKIPESNLYNENLPTTRSLRLRRQPVVEKPSTRSTKPVPVQINTRKRVFRQMTPEDSSSSDFSSSTTDTSDDDFKPATVLDSDSDLETVPSVKSAVKREATKPKYFSNMSSSKAVRKGSGGRIYFNTKSKLTPDEYYKNADLFENWEKFVRNESSVSAYYKTMFMKTNLTTLVIYHMEKHKQLVVDRSVELVSDGGIKITLESQDVTECFMKQLTIQTTTDLSALLINLINAKCCTGSTGFASVPIYPSAIFREDVWYSSKCTKVRFGYKEFKEYGQQHPIYNYNIMSLPTPTTCPPCTELRKHLEIEWKEIEKINNKTNRKFKHIPIVVEKQRQSQVRQGLSDIFFDFWTEIHCNTNEQHQENMEQIPPPTSIEQFSEDPNCPNMRSMENNDEMSYHNMENAVLFASSDCRLSASDPNNPIPLTPTTYLSDLQLNPSDMQNIQIMNMPDLSTEMIASLMNSSDSGALGGSQSAVVSEMNTHNMIPLLRTPGANPLVTDGTLMFPTFSLTDDL